ncbi:MAG: spore coat protein [Clostridia bacterium]|nr:spore coat protein [Clostridia bacterium]
MDDKTMMSAVLGNVKGMCDLMMHGAVEASTPNVHATFKCALNDMLILQNQIYSKMSEKGWYPQEQAEMQKITEAKQKFANAQ